MPAWPVSAGLVSVIGLVGAGLDVDVLAVGVVFQLGQVFQVDVQVGYFGQIGIAVQVFDRSEFWVIVQISRRTKIRVNFQISRFRQVHVTFQVSESGESALAI